MYMISLSTASYASHKYLDAVFVLFAAQLLILLYFYYAPLFWNPVLFPNRIEIGSSNFTCSQMFPSSRVSYKNLAAIGSAWPHFLRRERRMPPYCYDILLLVNKPPCMWRTYMITPPRRGYVIGTACLSVCLSVCQSICLSFCESDNLRISIKLVGMDMG